MSQKAPRKGQPSRNQARTAGTKAREHPCAVTLGNARDALPRKPQRCLLRKHQQNRAPWETSKRNKLSLEITSGLRDGHSCSPGLPKKSLRLS